METFSTLLALCEGKSPVTGESPSQRPVTRSFDVFFDLRLKNSWVNNRDAGDLRRHLAHYDVTVMFCGNFSRIGVKHYVYSLLPSDAIWPVSSGSTLAQLMDCCLKKIAITWTNVGISPKILCSINLNAVSQEVSTNIFCKVFGDYTFKIIATSPRGQWVKMEIDIIIIRPFPFRWSTLCPDIQQVWYQRRYGCVQNGQRSLRCSNRPFDLNLHVTVGAPPQKSYFDKSVAESWLSLQKIRHCPCCGQGIFLFTYRHHYSLYPTYLCWRSQLY